VQIQGDLRIALESSDCAAELALAHFRAGVDTVVKADGSPVTEADRAVERLLHERLTRACPNDAFLGEELGALGTSERVWILDPIDGTSCFIRRAPHWRVHVVLAVAGVLETAVVTAPALGRQWWASRNCGAFESTWPRRGEPTRLSVSRTSEMTDATLAARDEACRARLPSDAMLTSPNAQVWCAGLIQLVRGEVDCFFVEGSQVWDHAPWILLVEEAGGRFTDRTGGHDGGKGGGLYSNAALHADLLAAVGYPTVK
jgi:histidinol-phosphatase